MPKVIIFQEGKEIYDDNLENVGGTERGTRLSVKRKSGGTCK